MSDDNNTIDNENDETLSDDMDNDIDESGEEEVKLTTRVDWSKHSLRDRFGIIDKAATLALIEQELDAAINGEVSREEIAHAVRQVFDKLLAQSPANAKIALDTLANRAATILDATFDSEVLVKKSVKEYVRGESKRFAETSGAEGCCLVQAGKKGGVRVATEAFVKEYRERVAKKAAAAKK